MQLRCSVASDYFSDITPEAAVEAFAGAGFGCMELGQVHSKTLLERSGSPAKNGEDFARFAEDRGFSIPQGHLNLDMQLSCQTDVDQLKRELELFQGLGVKSAVLHAVGLPEAPYGQQLQVRSAAIRQLEAHIRGTDMTICLENLFMQPMLRTADTLLELIGCCDGTQLGICLDIGHLHRTRSHGLTDQTATEFIRKAGSRLKALHIHDNHGELDDHLFPFVKNGLDWKEFMQALAASGYDRLFNLEIHNEGSDLPLPLRILKLRYAKELCAYLQSDEFICG